MIARKISKHTFYAFVNVICLAHSRIAFFCKSEFFEGPLVLYYCVAQNHCDQTLNLIITIFAWTKNKWRHSRRTWGISPGADQVLKIRQKITHNLYRAHNVLKAAPFCDGNCQSNVKTLPHISGEAVLSHTSSLCIDCSDGKWSARSSSNVFPSWTLLWFPSSATYIWIEVHFTLCKPTESRFLSENTP